MQHLVLLLPLLGCKKTARLGFEEPMKSGRDQRGKGHTENKNKSIIKGEGSTQLTHVKLLSFTLQCKGGAEERKQDNGIPCKVIDLMSFPFLDNATDGMSSPLYICCGPILTLERWKVVDQVRKAVPLASMLDDDPCYAELKQLQEKKGEIDMLAHKQVRRILWSGLGFFVVQVGLLFRLTFWEFSWDVMEPIAFFGSTAGLLVGYAYFLFTSRDPTYQDLMKRLFLSRQRKLLQKKKFDMEKFMELQRHCKSPLDHHHAGVMGTQVP